MADGLTELRQAFTQYDHLLGRETASAMSLDELRARWPRRTRATRRRTTTRSSPTCPGCSVRLSGTGRNRSATAEQREAALTYVSAYVLGAKLVTKLGVIDLAMLAADRAASQPTRPIRSQRSGRGLSGRVRAAAIRSAGGGRAAGGRDGRAARTRTPARTRRRGLRRWCAVADLGGHRRPPDRPLRAWERLDRAERLAGMLGRDANHAWTAFGPTNVAIHRVSVAAELGDAGEALRAAEAVHEDRLPASLISRRAQVHLDLAWAQSQRKRDADATLHLLEAERIAPETIRHNVIAQEIVREMLAAVSARRRGRWLTWPAAPA